MTAQYSTSHQILHQSASVRSLPAATVRHGSPPNQRSLDFGSLLSNIPNPPMTRRTFLASTSTAMLAEAAAVGPPKRIAAVLTEYWLGSHADVVIGKYLEGYNQDDNPPYPRSKIVAMFTEHVPKNDMSRPMAKKYGVPIFRTVGEAPHAWQRQTRS